jgi:hypothetical protein
MSSVEEKLERLFDTLAEIQLSLEALRGSMTPLIAARQDHEDRLRSLERRHYKLLPLSAVTTFALGVLFKIGLEKLF